jgi:hypothetical protein
VNGGLEGAVGDPLGAAASVATISRPSLL